MMNGTYRDIAGSLGWPYAYAPSVRCVPVDTLIKALEDAHKRGEQDAQKEIDLLRAKLAEYEKWTLTAAENTERIFGEVSQMKDLSNKAIAASYARGAAEEREACAKILEKDLALYRDGDAAIFKALVAVLNANLSAIRSRTGGENE